MLLFVKGEILYLDICFLFCVQIITKGADTPSHLQWRITDSDQLLILLYPLLSLKSRFWIIYCSWCTFYHAMYRPTESVAWCQCCQQGVSLTDSQRSSDFLRNNDSPQIVHSSDNAGCLHISFSFSCRERPMCRSCFVLQCGTAHRPFPTIILQITLLVSVKGRRLYRRIYILKLLCYD